MLQSVAGRTGTLLLAVLLAVASLVVAGPAATAASTGPFATATWFVDPGSNAAREAERLRPASPDRAALFDRIATRPQADWFGDWVPTADLRDAVAARTSQIRGAGALPVYVTYAIPARDCGGYSAGGTDSPAAYRDWVDQFVAGLDGGRVVVVVEPDALALMDCLSTSQRQDRLALLRDAVDHLAAAGASVYLDAGHSGWHDAATIADRLHDAGVAEARGFALNVSNFRWTATEVAYARDVSARTGGARAVVDTSRNGQGPTSDGQWCNPDGRGMGPAPTAATADPVVDAYLWIKRPGESDGTCNGGPPAGSFWADYAEGLASRALTGDAPAPAPSPTSPPPDGPAPADPTPDDPGAARPPMLLADRVAGWDRVATALAASREGWQTSRTAVLGRSDDPADALAGTSLAGHHDAPLLVTGSGSLDPRVGEELGRLDVDEVLLLGGPAALGPEVVDGLRAAGVTSVRRVAGATRQGTAIAAATTLTTRATTVLVVHEWAWADALAVSGLAARRAAAGDPWPILLAGDTLSDETRDAIERLAPQRILVVGGTSVLPPSLDDQLARLDVRVERLAGATRHATSMAAATLDLQLHGGGPLLLATSAGFADGLASGALAARARGVLLLAPPAAADSAQLDWVRDARGELAGTTAVGGPLALSSATRTAMERARTTP